MKYASQTSVPVERSKAQIEQTIIRYGANSFGSMWEGDQAAIMFEMNGKRVKFVLPLRNPKDEEFTKRETGRTNIQVVDRSESEAFKLWSQACRQRWRALDLCIKAKLEAVECGITSFEQEFLPHFVIPGKKQTLGQLLIPQLDDAYSKGKPLTGLLEHHG